MEKKLNIQITEIFMAKAGKTGWDRCFHGTIRREKDENNNPVVMGKIKVKDGFIYAKAEDQWKLGEMLDEMVLMILDHNLHGNKGVSVNRYGFDYHLNLMHDFELLKRTYPTSQYERLCDGYDYIVKNSTEEERREWGIDLNELQKLIKEGEKYIYQVAKEGREFKVMCLCFTNYAIIRKKIFKLEDD